MVPVIYKGGNVMETTMKKNVTVAKSALTKAKKSGDVEKIAAAEAALAAAEAALAAAEAETEPKTEQVQDVPEQIEVTAKDGVTLESFGLDKYKVSNGKAVTEYKVMEETPFLSGSGEYETFLSNLYSTIDALCSAFNVAESVGDNVSKTLGGHIDKLAKCYNATSLKYALTLCWEDAEPLRYAVTTGQLYKTVSAVAKQVEGEKYLGRKIAEKERRVPIDKLHKFVEGGVGVDKKWIYTAQAVNKTFLARAIMGESKEDVKFADVWRSLGGYTMDQAAKALEAGENPVSNTKLLANLRRLISEMFGPEVGKLAIGVDVRHIMHAYLKEDKKDATGLTSEAATHKRFYDLISVVCHRILTGGTYKVTFK